MKSAKVAGPIRLAVLAAQELVRLSVPLATRCAAAGHERLANVVSSATGGAALLLKACLVPLPIAMLSGGFAGSAEAYVSTWPTGSTGKGLQAVLRAWVDGRAAALHRSGVLVELIDAAKSVASTALKPAAAPGGVKAAASGIGNTRSPVRSSSMEAGPPSKGTALKPVYMSNRLKYVSVDGANVFERARHSCSSLGLPEHMSFEASWTFPLSARQARIAKCNLMADAPGVLGLLAASASLAARKVPHGILLPDGIVDRLQWVYQSLTGEKAGRANAAKEGTNEPGSVIEARNALDDPTEEAAMCSLKQLLRLASLHAVPKGEYDDLYVIADALRQDGCVLSNDRMSDVVSDAVVRARKASQGKDKGGSKGKVRKRKSETAGATRRDDAVRGLARGWIARHRISFMFMKSGLNKGHVAPGQYSWPPVPSGGPEGRHPQSSSDTSDREKHAQLVTLPKLQL